MLNSRKAEEEPLLLQQESKEQDISSTDDDRAAAAEIKEPLLRRPLLPPRGHSVDSSAAAAEERRSTLSAGAALLAPAVQQLKRTFSLADHARIVALLILVLVAPALAYTARLLHWLHARLTSSAAACVSLGGVIRRRWRYFSSRAALLPRAIIAKLLCRAPPAAAVVSPSTTSASSAAGAGNSSSTSTSKFAAGGGKKKGTPAGAVVVPRPPALPPPCVAGYVELPLDGPDEHSAPGAVLSMYYELHAPPDHSSVAAGEEEIFFGPSSRGGSPPRHRLHKDWPPGEKTLLMLNPTGGRTETWQWTHSVQALTAAGFFVLLCDLRGQGRSSTPQGPYSLHQIARDVRGLLTHLGIRPHAFGWSLGGGVLLSLAASSPDSVRSCAVFGFTSDFSAGFTPLMHAVTRIIGSRRYIAALGVLGHGLLLNRVLNGQPTTDSPWPAALLRDARAAIQRSNGLDGYRWTLTACHSFFLPRRSPPPGSHSTSSPSLDSIAVPTLVMHTEGDGSLHGTATKEADVAAIRFGSMRTFGTDRRGRTEEPLLLDVFSPRYHMWPYERPNAFNRALLEWLTGGGATQPTAVAQGSSSRRRRWWWKRRISW